MQTKKKPFLTFSLSHTKYAIDISSVIKIMYIPHTIYFATNVPYLKGIVDKDGDSFPLLDIRTKLNLDIDGIDENPSVVVINLKNEMIALLIDTVIDIFNFTVENKKNNKDMIRNIQHHIKNNIVTINIIEIDNFLTDDELNNIISYKNAYINS